MITFDRVELLQALKKIVPVVRNKRGQIIRISIDDPISGTLRISGHNRLLAPSFTISHVLHADYDKTFDPFCVNALQFNAFVGAVSDHDVTVNVVKKATVKCGRNRVLLTLFDPNSFPIVHKPLELVSTFDAKVARRLFSAVEVTDASDFASVKSCVSLSFEDGLIKTIATDGNRCGVVWEENHNEQVMKLLIPGSVLRLVRENAWDGDLSVYYNNNVLFFVADKFYTYCLPANLDYPEELYSKLYGGLSDTLETGVVIDPTNLKDKLRACSMMVAKQTDYVPIKFIIVNEQLIIMTEENEAGEMSFTIPVSKQMGDDDVDFWVSSVYVETAMELLDFISGDGIDTVHLMIGEETGWVFLHKPGLQARFAIARFAR